MKYAFVHKRKAEPLRRELTKKSLIAEGYPIKKTKDKIGFPILKTFKKAGVEIKEVATKETKKQTLESLTKLPPSLSKLLPSGFDSVGGIAILELNEKLIKHEKKIAEAILKLHPQFVTVVRKASEHEGQFRLQQYKLLAGKRSLETLHKENDVLLKLHISKVYFSPRSSTERKRVSLQVKRDEKVLVMFSGCGPFCCIIAKKAKHVVGVELNPEAHRYALENKKLNREENLELIKGDVTKIVPKLGKFDRVLMPLPKTGEHFLELAASATKKHGIVHFYDFEEERFFPKKTVAKIKKIVGKIKVKNTVLCGSYSPGWNRVCIDFEVL